MQLYPFVPSCCPSSEDAWNVSACTTDLPGQPGQPLYGFLVWGSSTTTGPEVSVEEGLALDHTLGLPLQFCQSLYLTCFLAPALPLFFLWECQAPQQGSPTQPWLNPVSEQEVGACSSPGENNRVFA